MSLSTELTNLPAPQIVEELSVEEILARKKIQLKELFDRYGLPVDALDTPYEPSNILLENGSLDELILRQRINEVARSRLLAFAYGSDLDHLGIFYDVARMDGEDDTRFKLRIILAIQGRSTGGTEERYRFIAMTSDIRVADAIVYTLGRSPLIHVALFSNEPNGYASDELLLIVDRALQDKAVRMVNDTIIVARAVRKVANLEANIWLLPETAMSVMPALESNLRTAWQLTASLGRDLTLSWWTAKLMSDGVHRVEAITPLNDVIASPEEAISIGAIKLNYSGRGF